MAELIDLDTLTPPGELVRWPCLCGKDGSFAAHGAFTCDEVLQIRARVAYAQLPRWRRVYTRRPAG